MYLLPYHIALSVEMLQLYRACPHGKLLALDASRVSISESILVCIRKFDRKRTQLGKTGQGKGSFNQVGFFYPECIMCFPISVVHYAARALHRLLLSLCHLYFRLSGNALYRDGTYIAYCISANTVYKKNPISMQKNQATQQCLIVYNIHYEQLIH